RTIAKVRGLFAQYETPHGVIGLPEKLQAITKGGLLYILGVLESFMDAPLALERASALESCGLEMYAMVASQVRASYHGCRGETELARQHERKVERYVTRSGSAWPIEIW